MPTYEELVALQTIIDLRRGTVPSFNYLQSMARHIQSNAADISALSAGSTPGFAAALDLRWWAEDIGVADALEIVPQQGPGAGDTLTAGQWYWVKIAAANTGAAVTLTVRNAADTVRLVDDVKLHDGSDLSTGTLKAGDVGIFFYYNSGAVSEWRVLNLGGSTNAMINPMTAAGDLIIGGIAGAAERLAKGAAGRHMRAGASGPEYGGDVDMGGAVLRGHSAGIVTEVGSFSLNNTTHRGAVVKCTGTTPTVTIDRELTTAYTANYQAVILSDTADDVIIQADTAVSLNNITTGDATISARYKALSLIRVSADTWILINAQV